MAVKLSSLRFTRRIPARVSLRNFLSSISCAVNIKTTPDSDENLFNSNALEAKIQILRNKPHPDSLISVLDSTPDLSSSVKLFECASLQKRFHHTADTYQSMILKLGMAGDVEKMEGFCREMVEGKFPGAAESLLTLIDAFVSNHRLDEALRILYVMNLSGFKPSIEMINSLMGALLEENKYFKDVLFVYKEMVKAGINPDIDTLNYLLEALFKDERVDTAVDQYLRINKKGCHPNSRTFVILISNLVARNQVEESIVILNHMFKLGCEPDSHFYTSVIPLFCGLKNLEVGMRLFKMMRASKFVPELVTYQAVIKCFCHFHCMDDATKLFEEMTENSSWPDNEVHLDIVRGFCMLHKLDEAKEFLYENNVMDACVHNALLQSYCDNDNFLAAKDMFDEMFDKDITDAGSWNTVIRFLCEKTLINKALEYLSRMVVSFFYPDSGTYSAIIVGNCNIGNFEDAFELFRHVRLKCWVLDSLAYAHLIECLCQRAKTREATEVFCYMSGKGCALQSTSFSMLIKKICEDGKVNLAIMLLSVAHDTGVASSVGIYNSILRCLSKPCQKNHMLMIVSQMLIVGCPFDKETYCILIQSMTALNRVEDCTTLFNLMLNKGLLPDSETLACLLPCLAKHSQMHLIYSLIENILSEPSILDPAMYNLMVDSLWREGWKGEARYLLDLMLDKGWIPNSSTHALLLGDAIARKEMVSEESATKFFCEFDKISSILTTGLGKT